jgi:dTDP-4-dehydrorhamnose 3,5-epimerase
MQAQRLAIPDVICFTPKVFGDDRGLLYESFNKLEFEQALGQTTHHFVQDNHSRSAKEVLRQIASPNAAATRQVDARNARRGI